MYLTCRNGSWTCPAQYCSQKMKVLQQLLLAQKMLPRRRVPEEAFFVVCDFISLPRHPRRPVELSCSARQRAAGSNGGWSF